MNSRRPGPTSRRLLAVGLPLIAATLIAAGCSSSGGAGRGGGSGGGGGGSVGGASSSMGASNGASQAAATGASSASGVKITAGHLTDSAGRTVYRWAADTGSTSSCTGACLKVWPAVPASGTPTASGSAKPGDLSTIKRADSSTQLAYAGHPLYYFAHDTAEGDANGEGSSSFGAKWWELDSAGRAIMTADTPSASHSSSSSSSGGGYTY